MKDGKKRRHFWWTVKVFSLLALVLMSYLSYAFVYRGKVEVPTRAFSSNTGASVYSLKQLQTVMKKDYNLREYAFEPAKNMKENGTYIIPGLKATKTLVNKGGTLPAICTSMTPQGLTTTEDYLLISAYCHTQQHNSVIYVVDKYTHRFIKEIVLPGKPHAGGLAYDAKNQIVWVSSHAQGIAQAVAISIEDIKNYHFNSEKYSPVRLTQSCFLYGIVRDSFMTYYKGYLYVGWFTTKAESIICKYKIGKDGLLVESHNRELGMNLEMAMPESTVTIPKLIQGMAFYEDHLILSQSYGVMPSSLMIFENGETSEAFKHEESVKTFRLPEKLEQISVDGDNLYLLFESGAYAYQAASFKIVDRVIRMDLLKMLGDSG